VAVSDDIWVLAQFVNARDEEVANDSSSVSDGKSI
jgi:hypothetical protein